MTMTSIQTTARNCGIPDYMADGLELYLVHHIPPGDFLRAVLENDLMEAAQRADSTNQRCLFAYAVFLHNHAPSGSYGSKEAVAQWVDRRHEGEVDFS